MRRVLLAGVLTGLMSAAPAARQTPVPTSPVTGSSTLQLDRDAEHDMADGDYLTASLSKVFDAAVALPVATALGAALALRPRRRGTPRRSAPIVQTQIILAVIGALVMLVVGSSLARAFGVVGAAGLVRYRSKIQDPKDAGVMLSTLAVGLAAGVGLHLLAAFAALFVMAALWVIESFEPEAFRVLVLTVTTRDAATVRPGVEGLLQGQRAGFELRASSDAAFAYQVRLPAATGTDAVTTAILALPGATAVEWSEGAGKSSDEP